MLALLTVLALSAHAEPHATPDPGGLVDRVGVQHGLWQNAALSPDGRRVVVDAGEIESVTVKDGETYYGSESRMGPVRVLDVQSLEVLNELAVPDGAEVTDLAFGGERVAAALQLDGRHVVQIWAADTGKLLHRFDGHRSVHRVALSGDGTRLMFAGRELVSVDVDSGGVTGRRARSGVLAVDASGDRCLMTSEDGTLSVDCATLSRAVPAPTDRVVLAGAFTGDGRAVVTTDAWEMIWFDATSGKEVRRVQRRDRFDPNVLGSGRDGRVWVVQDSPHGDELCAWTPEPTDCRPMHWTITEVVESQASDGEPGAPIALSYHGVVPTFPSRSLTVPRDLQDLRVGGEEVRAVDMWGGLLRWDRTTGRADPPTMPGDSTRLARSWFPDLPTAQAEALRTWPRPGELALPMRAGETLVLPGADPTLIAPDGSVLARFEGEFWMDADILVSPNGRELAVGTYEMPVRIADLSTGRVDRELGHAGAEPLDWSPDGRTLALGSGPGVVLLDARSGAVEQTIEVEGVRDAAWSPDGRWLVLTGGDGQVQIWDSRGTKPIHAFRAQREVEALTFDDQGRLVTVGAGELRVWSTKAISRGKAGE